MIPLIGTIPIFNKGTVTSCQEQSRFFMRFFKKREVAPHCVLQRFEAALKLAPAETMEMTTYPT
jgi:hypothetical protein